MNGERAKINRMLTIWRRHTGSCPHRRKGRNVLKCNCPLWADGYVNGKRVLRQSLGTRDMARGRKKAVSLESPDNGVFKLVAEAVSAFLEHCKSEGLKHSTIRKYRNALTHLNGFCEQKGIDGISDLTTDGLDEFRAGRDLKPITALKELELLRQFCGFCWDRKWASENVARRIKAPRNIKPNDVVPFTPAEIQRITAACSEMGRTVYERLRAFGMVLTLRYTALRVGDVSLLSRDRITRDGNRWRIFLRTEKSGKPVFLPIPQELKDALDSVPFPGGSRPESKHYFWNGITTERAVKGIADRTLRAVFKKSGVANAHAHRFRHTLATELLGNGATFEDVADILGNSPEIVRRHYAKWSPARQARIDDLMQRVHSGTDYAITENPKLVQ
jgi:site-specific recombinase XerD